MTEAMREQFESWARHCDMRKYPEGSYVNSELCPSYRGPDQDNLRAALAQYATLAGETA